MKKKPEPGVVVGIDLGTTNSVAAVFESDGKPKIVPNADGDPLTPSVVNLRDEQHPVVGRAAARYVQNASRNGTIGVTVLGLSSPASTSSSIVLSFLRATRSSAVCSECRTR